MSRFFKWFIYYLEKISTQWYILILAIGIVSGYIFIKKYNNEKNRKYIYIWLSLEYYVLILVSTVFSRVKTDVYQMDLNPFVFLNKLIRGNIDNRYEVYLNILLLMPIGVLIGRVTKRHKVTTLGMILSFAIEILQYVLQKGTFETSDILMNTLGVLCGTFVLQGMIYIKKYSKNGFYDKK